MSAVVSALEAALPGCVHEEEAVRRAHSRDTWMLAELRDFEGRPNAIPRVVVQPNDSEQVARALRICAEHGAHVTPFGGGSGVCGAIEPDAESVVIDTRGLDGLVALDDRDLTARLRAGTMGDRAEALVREHGLTIGHWPQSVALSTVGGWVATRAAGQFSTAYGSIEDVVLALEVALPDGRLLRTRETPRSSAGPDLRQLFLGSEGTLGIVTEVEFSLRPVPEASEPQAFHFADLATGLEAIRLLMRAGWRPPVVRLYDGRESRRHFRDHCPKGRCMLILVHEGPAALVETERGAVASLCRAHGGEPGDTEAVRHWLGNRNEVPSFRSFLEQGVVADTIEVAATWSRVVPLYEAVTRSLAEVPGLLAGTAHSSHSYRSGTNLYFSFAVKPDDPTRLEASYRECWRRTMEATLAAGGGIAHHHGVGRVRRDYMAGEHGEAGVDVMRALQRALDPDHRMNPGNLLPD